MRVLAVGDIVAASGLHYLKTKLRRLRQEKGIDFCVVNGENTAVLGLTPAQAEEIRDAGADVITMGNHTWNKREIVPYMDDSRAILRPANFPPQQPGYGYGVYPTRFGDVAVIDLIGRCAMDYTPDNPFLAVEKILPKLGTKLIFVEIHAEATSEKLAMGHMLDGRVSAVWGTHTHVQTADESILPKGTGYITDLGMTGPLHSVLGIKPELSIARFRGDLTGRYEPAPGACKLCGCIFTVDPSSGRCTETERVLLHD
ncbi:MAG: YmdB family metallophosphoesterase [Oscillospiraceae bacterium]|jgi:metallophosphoesterase (TIGR00282 family)|nr:YmdB family metallophosphoesterase [Oscillospiraceae bacterium]